MIKNLEKDQKILLNNMVHFVLQKSRQNEEHELSITAEEVLLVQAKKRLMKAEEDKLSHQMELNRVSEEKNVSTKKFDKLFPRLRKQALEQQKLSQ